MNNCTATAETVTKVWGMSSWGLKSTDTRKGIHQTRAALLSERKMFLLLIQAVN